MSKVGQLMQVQESYTEFDRQLSKRLVKGASVLVTSITSVRKVNSDGKANPSKTPNKIQHKIAKDSGLVLNLVSLREVGNIKCLIQSVGNLAILKDVQENQLLLKVGLQTIIDKFLGNDRAGFKRKEIKV